MAATILVAVLLLFVMVAIRSGAIGQGRSFTQDSSDGPGDDDSIPPRQIEQYVAVYRAMQRNHSLTIEQACAQQGLTVSAFRAIEHKVERNDQVQTRVREALKGGAPAASPSP